MKEVLCRMEVNSEASGSLAAQRGACAAPPGLPQQLVKLPSHPPAFLPQTQPGSCSEEAVAGCSGVRWTSDWLSATLGVGRRFQGWEPSPGQCGIFSWMAGTPAHAIDPCPPPLVISLPQIPNSLHFPGKGNAALHIHYFAHSVLSTWNVPSCDLTSSY